MSASSAVATRSLIVAVELARSLRWELAGVQATLFSGGRWRAGACGVQLGCPPPPLALPRCVRQRASPATTHSLLQPALSLLLPSHFMPALQGLALQAVQSRKAGFSSAAAARAAAARRSAAPPHTDRGTRLRASGARSTTLFTGC